MKTLIKSILLGTTLTLSFAFADETPASAGEFESRIPDEDPSEETPKKPPGDITPSPGKTGKPQSKAGKKARSIKIAAKKKATQASKNPASQSVQEQIRLLNEKIDRLEAGQAPLATPTSAYAENAKDRTGYIPLPGTNTALKIGGYVKADMIYDVNQFTGDSSNLPNLRLKGLDADAMRSNVFTAHAKQTRISIGSETNTVYGEVMAYFEGDFFGSSNTGSSTGSFSRSDTSSLNSYNFRIRHAYGSYCYDHKHKINIGQMWTLFYDRESAGTTVEFNGPETTAQIRRPQIRYTYIGPFWKFAASLESGATEYLDISPEFVGTTSGLTAGSPSATYNTAQYRRAQNNFLGGISGDGNQALPDLVAQIRYEKKNTGHLTLSGMARELRIKKLTSTGPNDPLFTGKKYGYGVAVGGRLYVREKSNIFAQMSFGKGIGSYIFALDGYGAAMDASRGLMQTQFAYGCLIGAEHYWSDQWRSNIIYSQAQASISDIIPSGRSAVTGLNGGALATIATTGYSISNLMRQLYLNLLWTPAEKFEVGIEYAYFRRDTINNYFGYGNRFQFGAYYKF